MVFARARSLLVAALTVCLLVPALAFAQPQRTPTPTTARDQTFTFPEELVESSLPVPDGVSARGRRPRTGPTLIRHRAHFVPEMLRSVEAL